MIIGTYNESKREAGTAAMRSLSVLVIPQEPGDVVQ